MCLLKNQESVCFCQVQESDYYLLRNPIVAVCGRISLILSGPRIRLLSVEESDCCCMWKNQFVFVRSKNQIIIC